MKLDGHRIYGLVIDFLSLIGGSNNSMCIQQRLVVSLRVILCLDVASLLHHVKVARSSIRIHSYIRICILKFVVTTFQPNIRSHSTARGAHLRLITKGRPPNQVNRHRRSLYQSHNLILPFRFLS